MAEHTLEHVKLGGTDRSGYDITCIYALNPPEYAVYGTKIRTSIQYADDPVLAKQQRSAMSVCSPLRGQINGLIDGWRGNGRRSRSHRVGDYDRRVADALVMGFEGSLSSTLDLLTEIRNDIVAERRSLAQSDYLLTAVITLAALLMLFLGVRAGIGDTSHANPVWNAALTGASGGTLGAFFSIAVGMRSRTVLVDIQKWDNRRDAILRVLVGTIGGAVLICMLLTGLVTVLGLSLTEGPGDGALKALVIGFLAGFSERAVPDILAKASLATDAATGENATDVAADQARAHAAAAEQAQNAASAAGQGTVVVVGAPANDETAPVETGTGAPADGVTGDEAETHMPAADEGDPAAADGGEPPEDASSQADPPR
ncbi:MAG TPA: hypothetical protein VEZ20_03710 [Allosphingosinicella sp.]|jgi:hypothetical protein|nr:hypothetical protein [Allosphingosinicella sp.]